MEITFKLYSSETTLGRGKKRKYAREVNEEDSEVGYDEDDDENDVRVMMLMRRVEKEKIMMNRVMMAKRVMKEKKKMMRDTMVKKRMMRNMMMLTVKKLRMRCADL